MKINILTLIIIITMPILGHAESKNLISECNQVKALASQDNFTQEEIDALTHAMGCDEPLTAE